MSTRKCHQCCRQLFLGSKNTRACAALTPGPGQPRSHLLWGKRELQQPRPWSAANRPETVTHREAGTSLFQPTPTRAAWSGAAAQHARSSQLRAAFHFRSQEQLPEVVSPLCIPRPRWRTGERPEDRPDPRTRNRSQILLQAAPPPAAGR